jgi:hypothetical protein
LALHCLGPEAFLARNHSVEGLIDEYDETTGGCPDKLYCVDDAAQTLASWRSQNGERLADQFLSLYDCCRLSEAYRRNKKETTAKQTRRVIEQTSTTILFGATPLDATFPQHKQQQGLARRFLNYYSDTLGRFIPWPSSARIQEVANLFRPLLKLKGPLSLSGEALELWEEFQRTNRKRWGQIPEERPWERHALSTEPTHVLKIATHFEACRRVFSGENVLAELRKETLQLAMKHVLGCFGAVEILAGSGKRMETRQLAEELLEKIRHAFAPDTTYTDTIYVSRSKLTRRFCHNTSRRGSLQTDQLYLEIIPYLIQTGDAKMVFKKDRLEIYAFRASYDQPEPPSQGSSEPSKTTPPNLWEPEPIFPTKGPDSPHSTFPPQNSYENFKSDENGSLDGSKQTPEDFGESKIWKSENSPVYKNLQLFGCGTVESVEFESSPKEQSFSSEGKFKAGSGNFPIFGFSAHGSRAGLSPAPKLHEKGNLVTQASPLETEIFTYYAQTVETREIFEQLISNPSPVISLDFETYGKEQRDGLFPHLGEIRLLTVCLPQGKPVIFDLKRIGYAALPWGELFKSRETIVHNGMFEFKWALGKLGLRLPKLFDTMHACRLLQNGIDGGRQYASLSVVLERYLSRTISKLEQRSDFGGEYLSLDQLAYAARDVEHLADLRTELDRLMETAAGGSLLPVFELDMAYLPVLALREMLGIRFDVELAKALLADARMTIELAQLGLAELWGPNVTLNSPIQVKAAFVSLGFGDIPNTADDTLSGIDHEAARLMRNFRAAQARVKELERIIEYVHPNGRIYPDLDPLGTETARILSTKPTINNLSVDTGTRACILPDQPGHIVVKCDYSKEEPRIAADVFNVEQLKADFNAGPNIYKIFAAQIFGVPAEEVAPKQFGCG